MSATVTLSDTEQAQLGSVRTLRDGSPSAHPFPSAAQWPKLREHLVARSAKSNPDLDPELTAYTPGETLALLAHPEIKEWHETSAVGRIPEGYTKIVLVPCAKTKPWVGPGVARSKLYSAYNELRAEHPEVFFATVSEPLGIVPMDAWADFPQYDNPGLFRDDAQQSGMTKKEWEASAFGRWYGLPFDDEAWQASIDTLGGVVGEFLTANSDLEIIAALDNPTGPRTTHGAMLDVAIEASGVEVARFPKRIEARVSPLPYLQDVLAGRALDCQLNPPRPSLAPVLDMPEPLASAPTSLEPLAHSFS